MWPFDYVITWQMIKSYNWTSTIPMATKVGWVVTYGRKTHTLSYMTFWSHGHMSNIKLYICTSAILMTTKLGRVVTCGGGTQHSKSRDVLITWSRDIRKKLLSAFQQHLWQPNLAEQRSVVLRFLGDKIILILFYLTFRSSPP